MPLFFNWMWGNGKWNCSWARTSTCHAFCKSERWRELISLLAMLKLPLWDLYVWLSHCKACILCWASEAWTAFKKLGAPWALFDWKNQLTLSLLGAYKWFFFFFSCIGHQAVFALCWVVLCLTRVSVSQISKSWKLPSVVNSAPLHWSSLETGNEQVG